MEAPVAIQIRLAVVDVERLDFCRRGPLGNVSRAEFSRIAVLEKLEREAAAGGAAPAATPQAVPRNTQRGPGSPASRRKSRE